MLKRLKNIDAVPWKISDVAIVLSFIFIVSAGSIITTFIFIDHSDVQFGLSMFMSSIAGISIPMIWVKTRYGAKIETLGLKKGRYGWAIHVAIGCIAAVSLYGAIIANPYWDSLYLQVHTNKIENPWALLFIPLTLTGFIKFILSPLAEEIFLRGFVYGYLRTKTGWPGAMVLQSVFSALLHLTYLQSAFRPDDFLNFISYQAFIHLVLCLLYEKTKSLHAPVICHGMLNYLLYIMPLI
jgi:uncharacterized protein